MPKSKNLSSNLFPVADSVISLNSTSEDEAGEVTLTVMKPRASGAGQDRTMVLLEKLSKMAPMDPVVDDPHALMSALMMQGMQVPGPDVDPDAQALAMLQFSDAAAVQMGRSLGYCGCPRVDFDVGERVRVRAGLAPGFWGQESGACGTVVEGNPMMGLFPVSPMQPKGIMVSWDDGSESLIYVTNLEPLSSEEEEVASLGPPEDVATLPYVCCDCGCEQESMDTPCDGCGGPRVVVISLIEELIGPDWRENFEGGPVPGAQP